MCLQLGANSFFYNWEFALESNHGGRNCLSLFCLPAVSWHVFLFLFVFVIYEAKKSFTKSNFLFQMFHVMCFCFCLSMYLSLFVFVFCLSLSLTKEPAVFNNFFCVSLAMPDVSRCHVKTFCSKLTSDSSFTIAPPHKLREKKVHRRFSWEGI